MHIANGAWGRNSLATRSPCCGVTGSGLGRSREALTARVVSSSACLNIELTGCPVPFASQNLGAYCQRSMGAHAGSPCCGVRGFGRGVFTAQVVPSEVKVPTPSGRQCCEEPGLATVAKGLQGPRRCPPSGVLPASLAACRRHVGTGGKWFRSVRVLMPSDQGSSLSPFVPCGTFCLCTCVCGRLLLSGSPSCCARWLKPDLRGHHLGAGWPRRRTLVLLPRCQVP